MGCLVPVMVDKMAKTSKTTEKRPREAAFIGTPARVTELLKKESDRGVILILAAYLEEILGLIISAGCASPELADDILKLRAPAGDFESKLLVAQAFGLIHQEDAFALRIVQRIRNKAAHFDRSGRGFDVLFDSPATADQVVAFIKHFCPDLEISSRDPAILRKVFVMTGRICTTRLMLRLSETKPATPCPSARERTEQIISKLKDSPFLKHFKKAHTLAAAGDHSKMNELSDAIKRALEQAKKGEMELPDMQNVAEVASLMFGEMDSLRAILDEPSTQD